MSKITISPHSLPLLAKPTIDTPFHIDYAWWERQGLQISVELRSHLCDEHRAIFNDAVSVEEIDWVDKRTGEVTRVDGVQHMLQVHCSKQPDYINENLTLVNAVVRVFTANGNEPMSCRQLSEIIGHAPDKILRTISGGRVYKGIRPILAIHPGD